MGCEEGVELAALQSTVDTHTTKVMHVADIATHIVVDTIPFSI